MIVHSKQFVSDLSDDCIQPNAVDLKISKLLLITSEPFVLTDTHKQNRHKSEVPMFPDPKDNTKNIWHLYPGSYEFETEHYVNVPEGTAGWIIPRSTLNRNGVFITSGLYDSGFKNFIGGVMHITSGEVFLSPQTRIGQFVTLKAETDHNYDGQYQDGK